MKNSSSSSFIRKGSSSSAGLPVLRAVGAKAGPHGTSLLSTGFSDLDQIIGGGVPIGGMLCIMEDLEAPHHMLLLRYFMAQGLAHGQPLLYGSPHSSPPSFLGTLPGLSKTVKEFDSKDTAAQGEGLRIAWQYRRYLNEQQALEDRRKQQHVSTSSRNIIPSMESASLGNKHEFCSSFDLRRTLERSMYSRGNVECVNLQDETVSGLLEKCGSLISLLSRSVDGSHQIGRIALHSLCAPQCTHFKEDLETLSFLQALKGMLRVSNAVALITFPSRLLTGSFSARLQHMSDIVLWIHAIPDDDKDMATLLTDYQDMVGLMRVSKLPCINTQVPTVPEATTYAIKLLRRKALVLERLNQAPVDLTVSNQDGSSVATLLCAGPANASSLLDF